MPTKRKTYRRTSYACSICGYRKNSATLFGNHKQEHDKQAQKEMEFVCDNNLHTNVDSVLPVTMPNIKTNICLPAEDCNPYVSCYEMTMDDFEECFINDCYGVMEYDENNAIDYENNDDHNDHNNITQLNILENNDNISKNTLQMMFNEYKSKEIVHEEMKDTLKYSIELLTLLKNSNVSDALYDKLVDWLSSCNNVNALCSLPKRDTAMKQLSEQYVMEELYPEQKQCILPSINLPIYVPVHSFVTSLFTLLTASDLMKAQNLLL